MNIRIAKIEDLNKIDEIYNQAIKAGFQTGDIEPLGLERRIEWFKDHEAKCYPIFVCEVDNEIICYTSISPYRVGRLAFKKTAEISIYIDCKFQRNGIGSIMIQNAEQQAIKLGYETFIAIVLDANNSSIKLFAKNNYEQWGYLPNVAEFDGKKVSHIYFGKLLIEKK